MFSFFRRANKKSCETKKTKNQSTSKFINEIQCVPIEKFEINLIKNSNKKKESKRETLLKTVSRSSIMGNSESSAKKLAPSNEQTNADRNSLAREPNPLNLNNNVCPKTEMLKERNTEPRVENKIEMRNKIECKTNNSKFCYEMCSNLEGHRRQVGAETTFVKNKRADEECKISGDIRNDGERQKTTNVRVNDENKLNISKMVNENSKIQDSNLCSEGIRVMTNGINYVHVKNDKYEKEESNVAQTEQNFGTAPNSSTAEGVENQTSKILVDKISLQKESIAKSNNTRECNSKPAVELSMKNYNVSDKTCEEKPLLCLEINNSLMGEETKKLNPEECDTELIQNGRNFSSSVAKSETIISVEKGTLKMEKDEEEFEDADDKVENIIMEREKKPVFCIDLAENRFENVSRLGKNRIQIPDITITESSDSETENDSEYESETEYYRDSYHERIFPSILYDITEVDETFSDASDLDFCNLTSDDKRNVVHQETKFQEQIKTLKCEIESKDTENMQLKGKINDLQHDIMNKTWGMDRLHAELASFQTEADCVRKKLLKVEEDLNKYKIKNSELNEQLLKTLENGKDFKKVNVLQNEIEKLKTKLKEMQSELDTMKNEKLELQSKLKECENEKNEKIRTIEIALNETINQKQKLQTKFEEEYEKLRTVNSDREQQLLNDFEWKLREVELTCKRKLEEKDKNNEEKIKQIKENLEKEIVQLKEQLKEVEKMKSYEAEVSQLRGLTQEQERSLRMATKVSEQLHTNERVLNEEIEKLRSSLEKERMHLATVQGIHSREIAEKDRKYSFKLEQQKNELNAQWEDKIRRESVRLKLELEKTYKEEKRHLIEEFKTKADEQLKQNDQAWEKKMIDNKNELQDLEQKLSEKEELYRKELLRLQTNSDRDMLELRRKLDKMDLSYQEQLEKKQELHEQEIENLHKEYEKKIQQNEQNWSQQMSSNKDTLESLKEQIHRDAEDQIEVLNKKYMLQLEQQYERLMNEKEEALLELQEKYNSDIYEIQNKLNEELKVQKCRENELLEIINQLKEEIRIKSNSGSLLQENVIVLQNNICQLQEKILHYESLNAETEVTLQKRESKHEETILKMKECFENEIKYWKSKVLTLQKETPPIKENSPELIPKVELCHSNTSVQSKSRRKGRGKHKNQKHQYQHLTHQFSSSSL